LHIKSGINTINKSLETKNLLTNVTLTNEHSNVPTFVCALKLTPYFPGFILCHVLIVCYLMITVESMICGYHEYISKLSLESELDLLKYCNIDILTLILTQNKLKHTSLCCAHLILQNRKIGELEVIYQICLTSLLPKFFIIRYKLSFINAKWI